jgi:hypothetical protein
MWRPYRFLCPVKNAALESREAAQKIGGHSARSKRLKQKRHIFQHIRSSLQRGTVLDEALIRGAS